MSLDLDTGNIPSDIGGGAASMVMSFASGSIKHVETGATSYKSLAHFIYGGSDDIGEIINFNINAWVTNITSLNENNIRSMGVITNLPTQTAVIEIQGQKATGGGASKLRIGSVELQYE